MNPDEMPVDLLRLLRRLSLEADALIESCVRDRLPLRALLDRFLPRLEGWLGAKGAIVTTQDEHLLEQSFTWGAWPVLGGLEEHEPEGRAVPIGNGTALWTALRIAGREVGRLAVLVDGDRAGEDARLRMLVEAVFAELDVVLATIATAARKQQLIVEVEELLTDPVFDRGVDRAVAALHAEIAIPEFLLLYRDEIDHDRLRYRVYRDGAPTHASEGAAPRHPTLDGAIAEKRHALLEPDAPLLKLAAGMPQAVETLLSSGMSRVHWLGKILCGAGEHGFSTFALDVVQVMGEAMSQRLVDFHRERRHLAQFFAPEVIGELLADADYHARHLSPREEMVAVLFADINSFTKISEQVLEKPQEIARFVDAWSAQAVDCIWRHGGVFDKMVGDCVIGLYGPPFFKSPPAELARAALATARGIAAATIALEKEPPYDRIPDSHVVPGLGVAIGLHLCATSVGLMGPNQEYTGFSSGMNNTARLQSLAGYRETLASESFCDALGEAPGVTLSEILEKPVKNVKLPLRYRRVTFD